MMMNSSSFESPKSYLFGHYSKHGIKALLRYTGAKKYWHPYYINTIEMRSL